MLRKTFGINCLKTNHLSYNFMSLTYVFVRLGFRPQPVPESDLACNYFLLHVMTKTDFV